MSTVSEMEDHLSTSDSTPTQQEHAEGMEESVKQDSKCNFKHVADSASTTMAMTISMMCALLELMLNQPRG